MALVEVAGLSLGQCAKPGCIRSTIHRHHTGCERMWLRHFYHRRRTKKFRLFKLRYYEFRETDCVPLCSWHHEEIHTIYLPIITAFAQLHGKLSTLEWDEAEHLMSKLRKVCAEWLTQVTPGLRPVKR